MTFHSSAALVNVRRELFSKVAPSGEGTPYMDEASVKIGAPLPLPGDPLIYTFSWGDVNYNWGLGKMKRDVRQNMVLDLR